MKKLITLLVLITCSLAGSSQNKKPAPAKKVTYNDLSTGPLTQEIIWPSNNNDPKNKTSLVIKPRPVVVTKLKL